MTTAPADDGLLAPAPVPGLRTVVARAADHLAGVAVGEVLAVGRGAPGRYGPAVTGVRRLRRPADLVPVARWDTVVAVCELWRPAWTHERLRALARALRPGGRLLFVEPVAVTGLSGLGQRLLRPVTLRVDGLAFDRAVPDRLRAAGLTPISLVRTSLDPVGRVRTVVVGQAWCHPEPGEQGAGRAEAGPVGAARFPGQEASP